MNKHSRSAFVGYRSTVYGDESTPLIKVFESDLDLDEQMTRQLVHKYEDELSGLRHRDLKPSQIGRKAELEALVNQLISNCRHRVFTDRAGFLYDIRSCVCCGAHMGLV